VEGFTCASLGINLLTSLHICICTGSNNSPLLSTSMSPISNSPQLPPLYNSNFQYRDAPHLTVEYSAKFSKLTSYNWNNKLQFSQSNSPNYYMNASSHSSLEVRVISLSVLLFFLQSFNFILNKVTLCSSICTLLSEE
jgi:hypothetical protein